MENTKHGKRREGRWTPIRVKAQDTRANPNSWETHLVRKRWDIGLLRALSLRIMMMMMKGEESVEESGYEVLGIFEWQDKGVVALAKARTSEEGGGIWNMLL